MSLQEQVERLIAVSDALLDLEEVRAGDVVDGEQVDARQFIGELANRYRAKAAAQGRRIETAPAADPSSEVLLEANRHWLDVALGNLVSNALRHGEGTVTIAAAAAGHRVRLSVSDEGAGFPPGFIGRAFDRFARAETSRTGRGSGLGLSLVQAVAEAHGGSADITGACVALDLPARQTPHDATAPLHH